MSQAQAKYRRVIEEYLGERGIFAQEISQYEYRPEQIKMAEAVFSSLQEGGILVVEAGTGTGKTLAYLLPIILSNQRVVISTGTKNLQEQIFYKDLPLLRTHFDFRAVLMKGRANYLCWRRFYKTLSQPKLEFISDGEILQMIQSWAERTETGDKEELIELSEGHPIWEKLSSDAELCLASDCPHFRDCFLTRLKVKAQSAELIVVNHHLFFADLAVRRLGFGEVIPRYRSVIFDEAHLLEEVITEYFGVSISDRRILELARDLNSELRGLSKLEARELSQCSTRIQNLTEFVSSELRKFLERVAIEEEAKRVAFEAEKLAPLLVQNGLDLAKQLAQTSSILAEKKNAPELLALSQRAKKQAEDLTLIFSQDQPGFVYYAELRPKSLILRASPLEVAKLLKETLYPHLESIIFTSATLTTFAKEKHSFDYFKTRMGLAQEDNAENLVKELWLKTSFDWKKQAILFLPDFLPEPDEPEFVEKASELLERILELSQGRAFLLFTSYKNLEAFYERLAYRIPYPALRQKDKPRSELLREFKQVKGSVLFATTSFWQGVDVMGPALSLVVIDRLPFDSPSDPLVKARINAISLQGGNPFLDYQVPSAVIMLRQGLGRLIRSKKDRGALCVLDKRILKKSYGKIFLKSLPEIKMVKHLSEVEFFFEKLKNE